MTRRALIGQGQPAATSHPGSGHLLAWLNWSPHAQLATALGP
ncbi:hypothetical protein ACFQX7_10150 [Luedemannella flava]